MDEKMESLISIIVPVYNAEKHIENCINSLIAQDYYNIQIIIVDDGSRDSSYSICKHIAVEDSRVLLLHQENQGVSAARNYGISKATGEFIAFCDSDDMYAPRLLSTLYRNMMQKEADLSCCAYLKVTSFDNVALEGAASSEIVVLDKQNSVERIIQNGDGYLWNKLFKRSIVGINVFPEDIAILEDEIFVLQYMKDCERTVFTSEPLYMYLDNPESAVNRTKITNRKLTDIIARERIVEILEEMKINESIIGMVWNNLMKSYAISFKKLLMISNNEVAHWKTYIISGYSKRKNAYKRDKTWTAKELIYLAVLKLCSLRSQ